MNKSIEEQKRIRADKPHYCRFGPTPTKSVVTTLPAVSSTENGTGTGVATTDWYDREGNLTWSQDADRIPHSQSIRRDDRAANGNRAKRKHELLAGDHCQRHGRGSAPDYPHQHSPVATPLGDTTSLNVTTNYSYDNQGRLVQTLGPVHNADIDGATKSVRSARGPSTRTPSTRLFPRRAMKPWTTAGT